MDRRSLLRSRPVAAIVVVLLGAVIVFLWLFLSGSVAGRWYDIGVRSVPVVTDGYAPMDTTGLGPNLRDGYYPQVELLINDFSDRAAAWFRTAVVATAVSMGLASLTLLVLCYRLVRGTPFGRSTSWLVTGTGMALLIGGVLAPAADALGSFEALSGVSGIHEARPRIFTGGWMFYFPHTFDPVPVVLGLVFLLLAAVLSRGAGYYREVKELV